MDAQWEFATRHLVRQIALEVCAASQTDAEEFALHTKKTVAGSAVTRHAVQYLHGAPIRQLSAQDKLSPREAIAEQQGVQQEQSAVFHLGLRILQQYAQVRYLHKQAIAEQRRLQWEQRVVARRQIHIGKTQAGGGHAAYHVEEVCNIKHKLVLARLAEGQIHVLPGLHSKFLRHAIPNRAR